MFWEGAPCLGRLSHIMWQAAGHKDTLRGGGSDGGQLMEDNQFVMNDT